MPDMQPNTKPNKTNQGATQKNQNETICELTGHVKWGKGKLVWQRAKHQRAKTNDNQEI